jgi:hypothetical protein
MYAKDFKLNADVTVRGCDYGHFKLRELMPKSKGPQLVKVHHTSPGCGRPANYEEFDFALVKYFRISDITLEKR